MAGLNKVQLIGYLGRDPEIRSFQNGGKVASFSVATSETWRDKTSGERKEKTEWHRVSVLASGLVTLTEQYLKKGGRVYIEGRLETRDYTDKDGVKRYTTEIVLRPFGSTITMLDGVKATASNDAPETAPGVPAAAADDVIPF